MDNLYQTERWLRGTAASVLSFWLLLQMPSQFRETSRPRIIWGFIGVLRLLKVWLHPQDVLGLRILHRRSLEGESRPRYGFLRPLGPSQYTGGIRQQILDR